MGKIKLFINFTEKKIEKFGKKPFFFLMLVICIGIFLRVYNFGPWLHFELDQARDATLIQEAIDGGVGKLPLLGPRAAGTFLRLGPMFYNIEYVVSEALNDAIVGTAASILIFSMLSLPAFYFLMRRYFSKLNSMLLLTIFSLSLYVVTYSRFAWNPNMLPFFIIMFLLSLLLMTDNRIKGNIKGYWLIAASLFFSILSQLHFLALLILSISAVGFLIYKRPKIKLKYWLIAILLFLFLYTPMIINEYKTQGLNSKLFISATTKKSDDDGHNLPEKLVRNFTENADYYWVIITGSQTAQIPKLDLVGGIDIKCDQFCRNNLWEGFLAMSFYCGGLLLLLYKTLKQEKGDKKDFLVLALILYCVSFMIFTPLAYDFSARFFLIILPLPFLLLGLVFEYIHSFKIKYFAKGKLLVSLVFALLIISNIYFISRFFSQLEAAKDQFYELPQDKILKQKTRITLEQEKAIVDYIQEIQRKNNFPVIYKGSSEFHRSFAFLFDRRKIPRDGIKTSKICRDANYFLIFRSQSDLDRLTKKYRVVYDFIEKKSFN